MILVFVFRGAAYAAATIDGALTVFRFPGVDGPLVRDDFFIAFFGVWVRFTMTSVVVGGW